MEIVFGFGGWNLEFLRDVVGLYVFVWVLIMKLCRVVGFRVGCGCLSFRFVWIL